MEKDWQSGKRNEVRADSGYDDYIQNPDTGKMEGRKGHSAGGNISEKRLDKSGESGIIKATKKQREEFENNLKGIITSEGIAITGVSPHAADRMVERKKSAEDIKNILTNSAIHYPGKSKGTHCDQMDNTRVVYSDSGNIVTVVVL